MAKNNRKLSTDNIGL